MAAHHELNLHDVKHVEAGPVTRLPGDTPSFVRDITFKMKDGGLFTITLFSSEELSLNMEV